MLGFLRVRGVSLLAARRRPSLGRSCRTDCLHLLHSAAAYCARTGCARVLLRLCAIDETARDVIFNHCLLTECLCRRRRGRALLVAASISQPLAKVVASRGKNEIGEPLATPSRGGQWFHECQEISRVLSYIKELLPIAGAGTGLLPQGAYDSEARLGRADRLPGVAPRRSDKGHCRGGPSFQPCPGGKQTWRVSFY